MMSFSYLCRWAGLVFVSGLAGSTSAASLSEWKSRSVYQTMTDRFARTDGSTTSPCNTTAGLYCGGTWRGTINHLDYIQNMGFDAVMISPIIDNIKGRVSYGEAYHGYWPLDLYTLNSHFGTQQDLLDLSDALHSRGMYLLMDTVINNMAYMTDGKDPATNIDYSTLTPFNNADYYHPYCKISNWNNYTDAQLCQTGDNLVALPDLFTEHADVQKILEDWAHDVMKTYSVDGLRIDAAKSVDTGFLKSFGQSVGSFMTGEVYEQNFDIICNYQDNYIDSVPNYPMYYAILSAFTTGNISALFTEVELMKAACNDVTNMVSFSENHDVHRIASYNNDISIAKNVLTFTMLFDGIPMIYQGQEQHLDGSGVPENREALWLTGYNTDAVLYKLTQKLNFIRKQAYRMGSDYVEQKSVPVYLDSSAIAFMKGVNGRQVVTLLSSQSSKSTAYTVTLPVSFNALTNLVEVLNCQNYTVDVLGQLTVPMDKGEPRVFFPTELMEGSGLCGYSSANYTYANLVAGTKYTTTSGSSSTRQPMMSSRITPLLLGVVASFGFVMIL